MGLINKWYNTLLAVDNNDNEDSRTGNRIRPLNKAKDILKQFCFKCKCKLEFLDQMLDWENNSGKTIPEAYCPQCYIMVVDNYKEPKPVRKKRVHKPRPSIFKEPRV